MVEINTLSQKNVGLMFFNDEPDKFFRMHKLMCSIFPMMRTEVLSPRRIRRLWTFNVQLTLINYYSDVDIRRIAGHLLPSHTLNAF